MKELTVYFSDFYPDLIYFSSKFYWDENTFLVNKNFKTSVSGFKIQKYFFFDLTDNLNLKYFKIEIKN